MSVTARFLIKRERIVGRGICFKESSETDGSDDGDGSETCRGENGRWAIVCDRRKGRRWMKSYFANLTCAYTA